MIGIALIGNPFHCFIDGVKLVICALCGVFQHEFRAGELLLGLLCFWIADVGATAMLLRGRPSGEYRFYAAEMLLSVSAGAGGAALLLYFAAVGCAAELLPFARICAGEALLSLGAAIGLQKSAKKAAERKRKSGKERTEFAAQTPAAARQNGLPGSFAKERKGRRRFVSGYGGNPSTFRGGD